MATSSSSRAQASLQRGVREETVRSLRGAIEVVVLLMVCLSPWFFGSVHPISEFVLYASLGLILALWAARILIEWRLPWPRCPVAFCLVALFLLGVWQLTPHSDSLLAKLSPSTSSLYQELLPTAHEILPDGTPSERVSPSPGTTLSLYPQGTRTALVRLLAVLLLFLAVRQNCASAASLRRLALAGLFNGTLLAFFALIQFFSSKPQVLFWSFVSEGSVFGPFICRNHFPFYLNLCIGLSIGLLISLGAGRKHRRGLLQDPRALWIAAAIVLMVTSVAFSLSRGGVLSLLAGCLVCLLIRLFQSRRAGSWELIGLVAVSVVLLVGWFGFDLVAGRLGTIWEGEAYKESRAPVWSQLYPMVRDFPLWGAGYGSLPYLEPLYRSSTHDSGWVVEHAHNEYLEALVEGGAVRLVLMLAGIGFIYFLATRALRRGRGLPVGGLVLGAVLGFTTLVIHSVGDFGIHIPAIAVLTAVLAAQLSILGGPESSRAAKEPGAAEAQQVKFLGLAPAVGAIALVAFAVLLYGHGWKAYESERHRVAARKTSNEKALLAELAAAATWTPRDASLQLELAEAHLRRYKQQLANLDSTSRLLTATGILLAGTRSEALIPGAALATSWMAPDEVTRQWAETWQHGLDEQDFVPALKGYLLARDLCPLLEVPNVRLATNAGRLQSGDLSSAYLTRAVRLSPSDGEIAFACGHQWLREGNPKQAVQVWRHALECSDDHLKEILDQVKLLSDAELVKQVLPERADLVMRAISQLYPDVNDPARRPFDRMVVTLLDAQPGPLSAVDHHARATALRGLGQRDRAIDAFRSALSQEPSEAEWRLELAEVLYEQGKFEEAKRALSDVLTARPKHPKAEKLYQDITRRPH